MLEDRPMTIVEHLEELRVRLLISLVAFGIATIVGYLFVERILALLLQPVGQVVFLAPTEAFFVRLKVAGLAGVFLSLPVILYQIWRFVAMGLTPTERRYTLSMIPVAAGRKYALLGIVTASAVLTPTTDVVSQMLMAVPTYLLYEVSIWVARLVSPRAVPRESPEPTSSS